ncbi:MAG: DUF86 domain-containing protein [Phycisphaerae bacterium]|nr:DUF86 domain-containing protein [Phycisphaerae bacterium]
MKDDSVYLRHILESIEKIQRYIQQSEFDDFAANSLLIDAVVRNLEIIGEASGAISEDFKISYKEIPWRQMKGMRNALIHQYFGVEVKVVWNTCKQEIPALKTIIEKILK